LANAGADGADDATNALSMTTERELRISTT
jgi:hypothetical protein